MRLRLDVTLSLTPEAKSKMMAGERSDPSTLLGSPPPSGRSTKDVLIDGPPGEIFLFRDLDALGVHSHEAHTYYIPFFFNS